MNDSIGYNLVALKVDFATLSVGDSLDVKNNTVP